jgi:ribosomal-protein-serine acetyltransferase
VRILLNVDQDVIARPLTVSDAPAMHTLLSQNRTHLDMWLRWSGALQTLSDVERFIEMFEQKQAVRDGFHYGIWVADKLAGGVVCWYINRDNKNCELGYWLAASFTGQGLATKAARAAINYLFTQENLHRIEMQCGVQNTASRAVAERCGLIQEGIRRESHWITDRFVDHVVYGILARDYIHT